MRPTIRSLSSTSFMSPAASCLAAMLLPTSDGASKCGSLITIIFTPASFITVFPLAGNAAITASSKLPITAKKFFIFNYFMLQMYTKNIQQHSIF